MKVRAYFATSTRVRARVMGSYREVNNLPKRNGLSFVTTKQPTLKKRIETVLADRRKREEALRKEILGLIARGPPARSGISVDAWRSWHGRGFIICPASNGRYTCANHRCRMGADCRELRVLGLRGDRPDGHGKPRELAPYPQTWPAKSIELELQMIF